MNTLAFKFNFEGLAVVAFAGTCFAGYVDIRQEMHFYFNKAIALAFFASPALNVKAETPWFVASCSRFLGVSEDIADQCK